ncbi:MAG TPA: hypothetical protein VHW09_01870 [Bryobacteraceae bacterium]|nr:hypothetical protein [Bryobacteraceae bacterium]
MKCLAAILAFASIACAAESCDSRAARENQEWGKSGPHSWLASVEHTQIVETQRTWCHIFETQGIDRAEKGIDFGRVLFTGDGIHPSLGGIVPGSGFAGGLAYNLERASTSAPLRFSGSVEARGSYNGFWEAGGKLDVWGSANNPEGRHIHATIDAEHYTLPKMEYFGEGNSSSLANESFFSLNQTTAGGHLDVPLPGGFVLQGGLAGLWNDAAFGATPGTSTSYVVPGGGIGWIYPAVPRITGFVSSLTTAYKWFHEISGKPASFSRIDAIWVNRYTPPIKVNVGTVSVLARMVMVNATGGNRMPVYLQPTLGGTDISNVDALRSYRDYRFRAPNQMVFQAEYERSIWGPLAVLGFYDTGRVADTHSELEFAHLHHSMGAGLVIQVGGLPAFKFYYAWGGGEGSHTTYTLNTNNFTFNAPGGVF